MATGEDWSRLEVESCVADYLHMLALELNGQQFNKSNRIHELVQRLDGRSNSSVEYKFRNISAVMNELGWPTVTGYKSLANYQLLLMEVVESQLQSNIALQDAVQAAVERPATVASIENPTAIWVPIPKAATQVRESPAGYAARFSPAKRDYLAQEARNRSLGLAGEQFVMELEARRLYAAGMKSLSERVEHVSATQGDGLGYDVLSFEENGRERLIEVKTTSFGELTPFFVSRNELARSETDAESYRLYRLFDFRERPRLFDLPGAIAVHCQLDPVSYLAQLTS
ncbi:Protein NO VEIN C-terminal domain-containing protein [Rhodanobacter sp. Root179]|uniref:DUF3883 domain-containing protein n=1 Tax=Rhodanobacter sp. Root179 TaxID=1736482 RepID=UPI000AF3406A|nr:DUF3883 domain-containing protein [Rhodanobacter sp. Root179]